MDSTTIGIDLAKSVFELAIADGDGTIVERRRLTRGQFQRFFENRATARVVMEACGTAHYWGRWLRERGFEVTLLPPQYVKAYVRRNKTDRADVTAILEAARASDIHPVAVKSIEQQALQGLHRVRSAWLATKTARINTLRGLCREFGIIAPLRRAGVPTLTTQLSEDDCSVPALLRTALQQLIGEIRDIDGRMRAIERELAQIAQRSDLCQRLQKIPGVGLLTATAFLGTVGDVRNFRNPRAFASWLGLTPREYSSGLTRRLGGISKQGDRYLRMLLIHGGRAVLFSADLAKRAGRPLDALRHWGVKIRERSGHNKAAVAVANKLARVIWVMWRKDREFEFRQPRLAVV